MSRLYILILLLVAYGSLSPWQIASRPGSFNSDLTFFPGDLLVNVIVYLPVGFFGLLTLSRTIEIKRAAMLAIVIGGALSGLVEAAQLYIPHRSSTVMDVVANVVGCALGVVTAMLWNTREFYRLDDLLLIAVWAASVVLRVLGGRTAFAPYALTLVDVVIVIALLRSHKLPFNAACLAAAMGIGVAWRGLAPFKFNSRQSFDWVPFQASLSYQWELSLATVLVKAFRYGAIIRLLQLSGLRLWLATALTAAGLAAIEVVQIRLPEHVPEITDPLLAVILMIALWDIQSDPCYRSEEKANT